MNAQEYLHYLQSPEWKDRAKECIKHYGERCAVCKCGWRRRTLHVHHLHYQNVGNEQVEDLVVLCKTHHHEIHKMVEYDRQSLNIMIENFNSTENEETGEILLCSRCASPIDTQIKNGNVCGQCGGSPRWFRGTRGGGFIKLIDIAKTMI